METSMQGPLSFFLYFFVFVTFLLMSITNERKERRNAHEEIHELLKENNDLLKQLLEKVNAM